MKAILVAIKARNLCDLAIKQAKSFCHTFWSNGLAKLNNFHTANTETE